ncbi:unnamed protein product [Brassica rapa]|uniref:Uncharacterized protein n=1 Tax=Brassica campestris TaxID=3711 RepID=A0A8D9HYM6_BRACM|nr:unnamed protein product [Brassica rapa]
MNSSFLKESRSRQSFVSKLCIFFDGPLGHMLAMVCNGLLGCMLATGYDELSSQRLAMDQQAVMDRYVLMDLSITCLLWP